MSSETRKPRQRPFRTPWSVALFVVIALVICTLVMLWQLSSDPPDQPDSHRFEMPSAVRTVDG